jgi:hypothetical protein
MHAREVALHGVQHEAAVALVAAQVHLGCNLHLLKPDFLNGEDINDHQELVIKFKGVVDAMAYITLTEGVINHDLLNP